MTTPAPVVVVGLDLDTGHERARVDFERVLGFGRDRSAPLTPRSLGGVSGLRPPPSLHEPRFSSLLRIRTSRREIPRAFAQACIRAGLGRFHPNSQLLRWSAVTSQP